MKRINQKSTYQSLDILVLEKGSFRSNSEKRQREMTVFGVREEEIEWETKYFEGSALHLFSHLFENGTEVD